MVIVDSVFDAKWRSPLALHTTKFVMGALLAATVALAATVHSAAAAEPSAVGLWQKTDAETGNPVGWFLVVEQSGSYEGAIAKLFLRPNDSPNPICSNCRDDRRDQPLLGLSLIRGMQRNGLQYQGGNILDPRDGNVYNAMMTVSPDGESLIVRGYLGIALFGRDEVWQRLPDSALKELDPIVVAKYLPAQVKLNPTAALRHPEKTAKSTMSYR
jgi:uncharacterized protein (DUF2147 family)